MELDSNTKRAYIQLLTEVLIKKLGILDMLIGLTEQQEVLIKDDNFDEDQFLSIISQKEVHIESLNKLDDGFDKIYGSLKEEFLTNKESYIEEISRLKKLIPQMTDKSVKLQAMEKRNKSRMEAIFSKKRMDIKASRVNSRTAANYYKTMSQVQDSQSYFYDKKK